MSDAREAMISASHYDSSAAQRTSVTVPRGRRDDLQPVHGLFRRSQRVNTSYELSWKVKLAIKPTKHNSNCVSGTVRTKLYRGCFLGINKHPTEVTRKVRYEVITLPNTLSRVGTSSIPVSDTWLRVCRGHSTHQHGSMRP